MSPPTLRDLVSTRSALITQECQKGVLGEPAVFPELAEAARGGMVPNIARLAKAARASGIPVVHCIAERRADGIGSSNNARIFGAAKRADMRLEPGSQATEVIEEVGCESIDLVSRRLHGIGPMWGTDLDPLLRNLRVRTVVAVGVSVNIGLTNLVMDAVNAGYQVVVPRDAVAGIPASYADAIIDNTLSLLATITTTQEILEVWES